MNPTANGRVTTSLKSTHGAISPGGALVYVREEKISFGSGTRKGHGTSTLQRMILSLRSAVEGFTLARSNSEGLTFAFQRILSHPEVQTMKACAVILAIFSGAAAFVPQQVPAITRTAPAQVSVKDMDGILPPMGFFDPLGLASEADDATLGWYRHAEIKHGRVAMAAFVGWVVESNFKTPFLLSSSQNLKVYLL